MINIFNVVIIKLSMKLFKISYHDFWAIYLDYIDVKSYIEILFVAFSSPKTLDFTLVIKLKANLISNL